MRKCLVQKWQNHNLGDKIVLENLLIVVEIKTPNMTKVFHKIYWNLTILNGDVAGETYAFVYAKPPYLVMKSYAPFSKRQSWFWLSFKPWILV